MKRQNKYNAKAITVDGIRFDSTGEYHRWHDLQIRERLGEIRDLKRQVRFPMVVNGVKMGNRAYVADFAYREGNERIVEDFKGADTDMSKFKRELVKIIYGVDVKIVRARNGGSEVNITAKDAAMTEWKPIETAPTDGTEFLARQGNYYAISFYKDWAGKSSTLQVMVRPGQYSAARGWFNPDEWMPKP